MKPICVPCQRFFRPKRTGFTFTEGMPIGNDVPPGKSFADQWVPYKIWRGDLWECRGCGAQIISGTAAQPIAVQHEEHFAQYRDALNAAQFQVNDC
jgi:hypothetical protein